MKKNKGTIKEYQEVYNALNRLDLVNKSALPIVAAGTASSILLGPLPIIASAIISGSAIIISQTLFNEDSSLYRRYTSLQGSKEIANTEKQNLSDLMNRLQNKKAE